MDVLLQELLWIQFITFIYRLVCRSVSLIFFKPMFRGRCVSLIRHAVIGQERNHQFIAHSPAERRPGQTQPGCVSRSANSRHRQIK